MILSMDEAGIAETVVCNVVARCNERIFDTARQALTRQNSPYTFRFPKLN